MALVKTSFEKLGQSVKRFVSASSRAVCRLKKEAEAMQILYTGTKHALRHTQKRLFNVHGKNDIASEWLKFIIVRNSYPFSNFTPSQMKKILNRFKVHWETVYLIKIIPFMLNSSLTKNHVSVRSGPLDPEDVVFPEEEPGYEDETERKDLERFLCSVHRGPEARTVHEEVQEIFETVDKATPFRRGKVVMTWPTSYHDDKDNYHGAFAEGADPTVLFNTRSKLQRFQSTRIGKDVRLFVYWLMNFKRKAAI
jgi:hypothetical protein